MMNSAGHCSVCHTDFMANVYHACGGTPTPCGPSCSQRTYFAPAAQTLHMADVIHIDDGVVETLGRSRDELEALSVGDMIDLVLMQGYDIEITLRHSFDHGRLRFVMAEPVKR